MRKFFIAALLATSATAASAATINASATSTIATASGGSTGNHNHSSFLGVDTFNGNEVGRGIAEFNLAGLNGSDSATFSIRVNFFSTCCGGTPYQDPITISAYQGNNAVDLSDFQIATFASLNTFASAGLASGDVLTFDITSAFQQAVANGYTSLGLRLAGSATSGTQAITFDNVTLTTAADVPEPAMLGLFGMGAIGLGLARRRRA